MSAQGRDALVITVSDGVAEGRRDDESGQALVERLTALGFDPDATTVPDDAAAIQSAVRDGASTYALIVLTGGTGLTPRDVTPQALHGILEYEIPGFGELMRAEGRVSTVFAALSRSLAGVTAGTLVVAVPGSPRAALESLAALEPLLDHALETIADAHDHPVRTKADAARSAGTRTRGRARARPAGTTAPTGPDETA